MKNFLIVILCILYSNCHYATTTGSVVVPPEIDSPVKHLNDFRFNLSRSSTTSAGVYSFNDSTLIRTLWNNVVLSAGNHNSYWDGLTDMGESAGSGRFFVKVLSNNVKYKWEGVIGNTSDALTGPSVIHHPEGTMLDMVIAEGFAYYAVGYDEGYSSHAKFSVSKPNTKSYVIGPKRGMETTKVATDGSRVFWAGRSSIGKVKRKIIYETFVMATNVNDDTECNFISGKPYQTRFGRKYKSVISCFLSDSVTNTTITGLAVQRSGKFLFIARGWMDTLYVLDKITGTVAQKLLLDSVKTVSVDNNDNLWLEQGVHGQPTKYTVNSNGTLSGPKLSLSKISTPFAIGFSPDNVTVVVIDGDKTSQQLKAFNVNTGALLWTFGQAGGYYQSPEVSNTKFFFSDTKKFSNVKSFTFSTFIAFQQNGSFWVGDQGNCRALHFTANRTYIDNIMNLGYFYSSFADVNNPKRVFANYLEFEIDYQKLSDKGANDSWRLVRNWSGGVNVSFDDDRMRLKDVTTLKNGRTYAFVPDKKKRSAAMVELPSSGLLRYTGLSFGKRWKEVALNADGSLSTIKSINLGVEPMWQKIPLLGFDKENNPIYGNAITIAKATPLSGSDPISPTESVIANPITKSGVIITYTPDMPNNVRGYNFHLGGVKINGDKWLWRTSRITTKSYKGPFPTDGTFDIGNGVVYAGGFARVVDNSIFTTYHGEFWKQSQVNKWNHFYDNGLMVGQFGVTRSEAMAITPEAPPAFAGNVLSGTVVKINNDTYFAYHNDESAHGGISVWKISGLNSILEQVIMLPKSSR